MSLLTDDEGTFDKGGARVVDAIQHGLASELVARPALKRARSDGGCSILPLIESSWPVLALTRGLNLVSFGMVVVVILICTER